MTSSLLIPLALALLVPALGARADAQGTVHSDPARICPDAKPHEICFDKPNDGMARVEYRSAPFYAVILKTAPRCTITEATRLQAQALFPHRKVFSTRFECDDDIEENISYSNVDPKHGFLGVHAGTTLVEARQTLGEVKATGRFPGANIRKIRARLVYP